MKNVLILGAGQSSPYLIYYMLNEAEKYNWEVIVADYNQDAALAKINNHPKGKAIQFDVKDDNLRNKLIKNADVVINLLAPPFQFLIASDCLKHGKSVISASYENKKVAALNKEAQEKGILILNEMGLDPGIDHMSAMSLIQKIHNENGIVNSFISYGSAIPAPDVKSNPINYCITWNSRNVVMAGEMGAIYLENDKIKIVPYSQLFNRTTQVEVEEVGKLEAYPNRDSVIYKDIFGLKNVKTMIRGTLRYPGYSELWSQIVKLGLPNENVEIPKLSEITYREYTEMFVPQSANSVNLEDRVANFLKISPTGVIMDKLKWLGLFDDKVIGGKVKTSTEVMQKILNEKLPLPSGKRDMVILMHILEAEYPNANTRKKYISTLIDYGEPNGITSIAKTVGAPAAIAAKLILLGELNIAGTHIPTHPLIYSSVLKELEALKLKFIEKIEDIN